MFGRHRPVDYETAVGKALDQSFKIEKTDKNESNYH